MNFRPRRSVLYMPGSNARALEKARVLPVDVVILDLEDAVSPDNKEMARQQVLRAVNEGGFGHREVIVRINGLETEWGVSDLASFATAPVDAILLPKIDKPEHVEHAESLMISHHYSSSIALWVMIETPLAVIQVNEISQSSSLLQAIVMGTSDLAKELRIPHTSDRAGFTYALSRCVMAARAFELDIIDGVHLDLSDKNGLELSCKQGRELGFDGKSLIHPSQVDLANRYFSPTAESIQFATKVLESWKASKDKQLLVVDGKLIELLHIEEAERVLAISNIISGLTK